MPSPTRPCGSRWLRLACPLVLMGAGAMLSPVLAQTAPLPWLLPVWKTSFSIPAGNYIGPEKGGIGVHDKSRITWQPGSIIRKVGFDVGGESQITASGCLFQEVRFGLGLWARFKAADSAFDNVTMMKTGRWFDKKNSSTNWRFENCVFTKKFMRNDVLVMDVSVVAKNCTFIDLKVPGIHYRNNDAANQAQQNWLKFEKCRFINCEVNENALLMAVDCVFENCTYAGTKKWWGSKLKKPLSVTAYWSGRPEASYQQDKLTVTFIATAPPFQAGATLPHRYERGTLTLPQLVAARAPAQILGSMTEKKTENPAPAAPAPPAMVYSSAVTGSSGARTIPLKLSKAAINALLVVDLPGQGEAGAAVRLSSLTLPIAADASSEVIFNQPVGPQMEAALREVAKFVQIRHQGWSKGQRVELSFADKYSPKDGPSAAVACALLLDSMMAGWEIDPEFAVTGDLNADGSVQPIGGVSGKIRGATKGKCTRLAVPHKNRLAVADVLVLEGPRPFAMLEVFSINNFDDAHELAAPLATPKLTQASALFSEVQTVLLPRGEFNHAALNDPGVKQRLQQIIELAPNHLSAHLLLAQASGNVPRLLSLAGSIEAVDDAGASLLRSIKAKDEKSMRGLSRDELGAALSRLVSIRPKLDARVHPTLDALHRFGTELRQWQNQPPQGKTRIAQAWASLKGSAEEADRERGKLATDREVLEELMQ